MIGITPAIHALGGGPRRLVSLGALVPSAGFTRSSAALVTGSGATWQQVVAETPRFSGTSRRLLVEGQRTNRIRNPRLEGAAAPSTSPTNMSLGLGTSGGVARSIAGAGNVGDLPYVDILFSGTASSTTTLVLYLDGTGAATGITAASGDLWTQSVFLSVTGTNPSNIGIVHALRMYDSGGTLVGSGGVLSATVTPSSSLARSGFTGTLNQASTASIVPTLRITLTSGVAYNEVLRIAAPQLEQAAFASSPILPPGGTPAASTRLADVPTHVLQAGAQQRGTLVGTFLLAQAAPAGAHQGLMALDDGTVNNRFGLHNSAGGLTIGVVRAVAGAEAAGTVAGTVVAGTPFKAALAWDLNGIAACVNGGAVQALSGSNPGVSRLLIGQSRADLATALFGEVGVLDLHVSRLPDASLQALTAAG